MNKGHKRWGWLLGGLVLWAGGCSRGDTERLASVGRKITEKLDAASADTNDRFYAGWQSFRTTMECSSLDGRVAIRLRWDKALADTPIRVEATGAVVTLSGQVAGLEQRRRAVALAETTQGVEQVIDLLTTPKPE
jgi:osmotically-inducible protein OsmY